MTFWCPPVPPYPPSQCHISYNLLVLWFILSVHFKIYHLQSAGSKPKYQDLIFDRRLDTKFRKLHDIEVQIKLFWWTTPDPNCYQVKHLNTDEVISPLIWAVVSEYWSKLILQAQSLKRIRNTRVPTLSDNSQRCLSSNDNRLESILIRTQNPGKLWPILKIMKLWSKIKRSLQRGLWRYRLAVRPWHIPLVW